MIDRYPDAIWSPGPAGNIYAGANPAQGVVCHSVEGNYSDAYTPIDTMRERQVSWHFTIMQDGSVWQHYALSARCWHSGGRGNFSAIGIEHEGRKGEPLTPLQLAASVRLVRWIAEQGGWRMGRDNPGRTLWEHHEISGTSCPNGRIPWHAYTQEDEMDVIKLSQADALPAVLGALAGIAGAVGQQDGQWIGVSASAPHGYRDIVIRVKG